MQDLGRLLGGKPPLEWEYLAGAPDTPEWRHRLKAPLLPMAASLQSLELELMDRADLCHIPDYFDALVALTSLTLSGAGLRVSPLLMLFGSGSFAASYGQQDGLQVLRPGRYLNHLKILSLPFNGELTALPSLRMHAPCLEALRLVCAGIQHFDVNDLARHTALKRVTVATEVSKA